MLQEHGELAGGGAYEPNSDAPSSGSSWHLVGNGIIEGVFGDETFCLGCGKQSAVTTDEGERMAQ